MALAAAVAAAAAPVAAGAAALPPSAHLPVAGPQAPTGGAGCAVVVAMGPSVTAALLVALVAVAAALLVAQLPAALALIAGPVAVAVAKSGGLYRPPAHGSAPGALARAGLDDGLFGLIVDEAAS